MTEEVIFNTRAELTNGFTEALRRHTERYEQEGRSNFGEGWIKSQILESDIHHQVDDANESSVLRRLESIVGRHEGMSVRQLNDESFYLIRFQRRNYHGNFYVDASDPRFLAVFTKAKSSTFTTVINKLTEDESLDHAWFPDEVLYSFKGLGYFRGYGGNFNNRYFLDRQDDEVVDIEDDSRYRDISSKSRGNAERLLRLIRSDTQLKNEFALTSLRLKKLIPESDDESAIDDITFTGKFTTVGKSFVAHQRLIDEVMRDYRKLVVEVIEQQHGLKLENGNISGEKLVIRFPRVESNLHDFAKRLFSGKKPFMLWGIPDKIDDSFVRVHAMDLHIGKSLTFELTPDSISAILPDGVCGNTIMRLVTLLQQNYGSQVQAKSEGDRMLFNTD